MAAARRPDLVRVGAGGERDANVGVSGISAMRAMILRDTGGGFVVGAFGAPAARPFSASAAAFVASTGGEARAGDAAGSGGKGGKGGSSTTRTSTPASPFDIGNSSTAPSPSPLPLPPPPLTSVSSSSSSPSSPSSDTDDGVHGGGGGEPRCAKTKEASGRRTMRRARGPVGAPWCVGEKGSARESVGAERFAPRVGRARRASAGVRLYFFFTQ